MKRVFFSWQLLLLVAACGKSSDSTTGGSPPSTAEVSCRDAATHVGTVVKNPKVVASFADACTKEEWAPEIRKCFANAADQAGIIECQDKTRKTDRAKSFGKLALKNEAQVNLEKLRAFAKDTFTKTGGYPAVTAPVTPAEDCCKGIKGRCRNTVWSTPEWQALQFTISGSHLFRYSYEGTATSFVAKAVGDLDCDGVPITYEIRGTVRDGAPYFDIVDPPPNAD